MTIPLDNLYHYVYSLFKEPVCMYLFYPYGSKNILDVTDLQELTKLAFDSDSVVFPLVLCNDQEPLDYYYYENLPDHVVQQLKEKKSNSGHDASHLTNLRLSVAHTNIYDKIILMHSEKNSLDLELYEKEDYIGVYYWCHAIIARDWYRFAEYDQRLIALQPPNKDFLIYCRDWTGSREYRIKFQELLYKNDLTYRSITSIRTNNDYTNVKNYNFKNQLFIPTSIDFLYHLSDNQHDSSASADYCPNDFTQTKISVVLETVFDTTKIHLTEKILRPIACGHPFILAAGPGSLTYLKNYGFKTFSPWIDESYDLESDSFKRLEKIIYSMQQFSNLHAKEKLDVYNEIKKIADYNRQWFFSNKFFELVKGELVSNIDIAMHKIKNTRCLKFRSRKKIQPIKYKSIQRKKIISKYLRELKKLNPPG
jgi:hypothetical protein